PASQQSLLTMGHAGYRNITDSVTLGYTESQRNGLVTVHRDWVAADSAGVIALSGAKEGEIGQALLPSDPAQADRLAKYWMQVFPGRFYLELQRTSRVNDEQYLHAAVALAGRL